MEFFFYFLVLLNSKFVECKVGWDDPIDGTNLMIFFLCFACMALLSVLIVTYACCQFWKMRKTRRIYSGELENCGFRILKLLIDFFYFSDYEPYIDD